MTSWRRLCLAAVSLAATVAAGAGQPPGTAHDPTWLKLGHYEPARDTASGWRSTIHPGDFFLATAGHADPTAELAATIAAMNAPPAAEKDLHAQCRFPARLLWLKQQHEQAFRADIDCPGFGAWTRSGSVTSISVVLASGFLGTPASYYGHTLLKFNFRDSSAQTSLLDESASYGAIDEGRPDNPVVYIVRSLLHGYDAGFSHIRFYFHDHHYGNEELRDMWEYRLDLSDRDRDLVVAHTWEVLGKHYTYEFFHGNCALRMAEIIELADGVDIAPRNRPWVVPQALTAKLANATYHGRALVGDVIYHPSRQSRFYGKYLALPLAQRKELHRLILKEQSLEDESFRGLTIGAQQAVLDALLDYHQFVDNPVDKAPAEARASYNAALSARFQLPPGEPEVPSRTPSPPHGAHAPGWVQGGWAHNDAIGDLWSLRLRATYYDALDFASSHVRFSSLVMGDLRLDLFDGRVRLNHFDLVRVESVKPGVSGLPGDRGTAWKLGVGAEQARLGCRDCLTGRLQGDMGYTYLWLDRVLFGAYAGGALQTETADQGWGFGRATGSLNVDLGNALRLRMAYEHRLPVGAGMSSYGTGKAELRWSWGNQGDLRIGYSRDRVDEIGIGLGLYW
jgi:hypothetical protein